MAELGATYNYRKVVAVTPANADLADGKCRALLIGTAGTLNIMDESGTTVTGLKVPVGVLPIVCLQVRTGGTATDIFALY
jgi:hypothetical protein